MNLIVISEFPRIRPFVIAIWCGEGKPPVNEYLREFVDELNSLLETNITINGHHIKIKIKCFICDTPARAFIKGNEYNSIEHSTVEKKNSACNS